MLRARASRIAALIAVDFWLHLFIKKKVEKSYASAPIVRIGTTTTRGVVRDTINHFGRLKDPTAEGH